MKKTMLVLLATAWSAVAFGMPAAKPAADAPQQKFDRAKIAIPYQKFVLDNGLTLLVHEDHSTPVVGVNLWYHVGSRNEKRGKTGFAHLFEHFFFNGSEHYPHGFREAMDDLGATNRNGTTNTDRTNFFEDVPTAALERTLYLEADRMGFLEKQISKEMLERERGVVQNEKRQGENRPYGRVDIQIVETIYPWSHPYSWSTIGSMEDLNAAQLDDVREWYRTYYGPNNCVLSLAGDITPEHALELVKKYFGGIPPGPPLRRIEEWVPHLDRNIRDVSQDRVPQARVYRIYTAPGWRSADVPLLQLVASVLSGSRSARLDRRLVYDKQLAIAVEAGVEEGELASVIAITATVKPGVEPAAVEQEIDNVIKQFLAEGPTADELKRAQSRELAGFVRGTERLGGFGGRSDVLAESMTYGGKPDAYLDRLEAQANATPAALKSTAKKWLDANHYTLVVNPYPNLAPGKTAVDRAVLPAISNEAGDSRFPAIQNATLKNGLKVVLLERRSVPMVNAALVVDAGYAADPIEKRGTASLAVSLLDKGTATRDAFQIIDEEDAIGARITAYNLLDLSVVRLSALTANLRPSLDLFADVVLHPTFPEDMVAISRRQRIAEINLERSDARRMAQRFIPRLLFGASHAYGGPLSGYGTEQGVSSLTRGDFAAWHKAWFHPNNSTIVVTGDVTMPQLLPELERTFGSWRPGDAPKKNVPPVTAATVSKKIYLVDKPDAPQSVIVGAQLTDAPTGAADIAADVVLTDFGGMATSRLNRNLRLDKHWSYGSGAQLINARGTRPLLVVAPVQTDKTKEALAEVLKEVKMIAGEKPIAGEEFASIMRTETLSLPGAFATLRAIENAAVDTINYGYPTDYYSKYAQHVNALTEADLASAAKRMVKPEEMIWVVVGDVKKIEAGIRELNAGEVVKVDADGNPIP